MNPLATKRPGQKATDSANPVTRLANLSPTMLTDWNVLPTTPAASAVWPPNHSVTSGPPESQVYLPPSEKDADADPTVQQRLSPMSI